MTDRPKVFCIGFHKTGTTSLYAALSELGFRVTGTVLHKASADEIRTNGAQYCIDKMKDFDAAEDMPWPHFYRDLDAAYPGSKFILTTRDPDRWFTSIDNHFGHQETDLNAFAYGNEKAKARGNRDHWVATYNAHNDDVRKFFANRPDQLLEIDITQNGDWQRICAFLGLRVPQKPFPAKNTSADRKSLTYRVKRKLWKLVGRTPHPERML